MEPGDDTGWADPLLGQLDRKVDVCVDMVASTSTLANGLRLVGRAGTFVIIGFQPGATLALDPAGLLLDEIVVTGSRYATRAEIAATLQLVAERRIEPVIGARYGLEDTPQAYRAMQANEAFGRIVVERK